ncbi:hypothetical protein AAMO2058_000642300 [Amorphochlora amoebiformis]
MLMTSEDIDEAKSQATNKKEAEPDAFDVEYGEEIEGLFRKARLEQYIQKIREEDITLSEIMLAESKVLNTMLSRLGMKTGHKARLRGEMDKLKKEGWMPTALPSLQRSLSNISDKLGANEFREAVHSNDGEVVFSFIKKWDSDRKSLRHFFVERFKYQTSQGLRSLKDEDLETLFWIKDLYFKPAIKDSQPLPYKRKAENFVQHLFQIEGAVKGMNAIWTISSPASIVYGFLSRKKAYAILEHAKDGVFLFRLSVSTPTKMAFCYNLKGTVRQTLVPAFKNIEDFEAFSSKYKQGMKFVADPDSTDLIPLASLLKMLKSDDYRKKMKSAWKKIKLLYGVPEAS